MATLFWALVFLAPAQRELSSLKTQFRDLSSCVDAGESQPPFILEKCLQGLSDVREADYHFYEERRSQDYEGRASPRGR